MKTIAPVRRSKPSEEGYILVAVMFMLAALVIAMSVAEPRIAASIQRDRELETMRRGKQYARAVKLYYKQFNSYPPNVDALVQTNNIRYLRKKYLDPTTGKADWRPIPFGQQKTQTLGFFGQPIGGTPGAGLTNSLTPNTFGSPGGTPTGGPTPGGIFSPSDSSSSPTGSNPPGASPAAPTTGAIDPTTGQPVTGTSSGLSGGTGPPGSTGTTGNDTNGMSAIGTPGANGQVMGVGIMGFSPASPKQSILVYKKKNHYNEWEFLYDPLAEQMMQMGGMGATGTGLTPAGTPNGSAPGTNNGGFGSSPTPGTPAGIGPGSSPMSPPTQPQQ
jgi:type II secretory pathway pseudopilin PulG